MDGRRVTVVILQLAFFLIASPVQADQFSEHLSFRKNQIHETVVTIPQRGWYSFQTESLEGASLKITDRMAGLLATDGTPGGQDGRIDLLLEPGEYLIGVTPARSETGDTELHVLSFNERGGDGKALDYPYLGNLDFISTTLNDLETRSYWIEVGADEPLLFEIMGRNLVDVTLWLDGEWGQNLSPLSKSTYAPSPGQPMRYFEFGSTVPAGLYLLQCTGGETSPWPEENGSHPLFLRRGVEYKGRDNVVPHTISPFGRDSHLPSTPGNRNFFSIAHIADRFPLFAKPAVL